MKTVYFCECCNHAHNDEDDIANCTDCNKEICSECYDKITDSEDCINEDSCCKKCGDVQIKKFAKACLECERPFAEFGGPHRNKSDIATDKYFYGFCDDCWINWGEEIES